ncbi:MAG: hypothetical protein JXR97_07330, partial [Planctomycetes bacterium]|nr:hypothetical protein [Planctomycetota bacterium]
ELRIMREGSVLASEMVEPSEDSDLKRVRIPFTPDHNGTAIYTAEIPVIEGETVAENNVKEFSIHISDDRLPVLYIEGSPRMEYRFLRRAMFRDPNFRVVGMLRLAADRVYVQGANPEESYLAQGFPKTKEQLFKYQAIILGDIEASYFSKDQLQMLEEFVKERGGGLLMLGGVNSFGQGGYDRTPVEKALPLNISSMDPPYSDSTYVPVLAEQGLNHPVMRLVPDERQNRLLWETIPPLIGITPVRGVKSGATLLLKNPKDGLPVLAVQNYGAGRVAAFTSGGSWYWQVSMPASNEFHERFWKQLIRWLVIGAKDHLVASTDADSYARQGPVIVQAEVLGKDLRPNNEATVIATITDPIGNSEDIPMDWILSQEGVYQARYVPDLEGNYSVKVHVADMEVADVVTSFRVAEPLVEFSDAGLKRELLKNMTEISGGKYFEYPDTKDLVVTAKDDARRLQRTAAVSRRDLVWDMPLIFLMLLGVFAVEWIVRRRSGLA